MNIDTNTLIFIALAIMMILIVICFICNSINSSKINTLMDYSDEGDIISALKDYYDKVDDLSIDIDSFKIACMKDKPKAIYCTHVSNVTGYILPIDKIGEIASKFNSLFIVDGDCVE